MKSRPALPLAASLRAFTLIELLVVIAIIAILAGLLLSTAGYMQEKAARSRAEAEIKAVEAALENYKVDFGSYPTGTTTVALVNALMPTDPAQKVYFSFPNKMLSTPTGATRELVDPFGNNYHYKFPGDPNQSGADFFDLWSQGKGGSPGNDNSPDKWIKNW